MRTYFKCVRRMFGKNIQRFISIIFIVAISVGLTFGIGSSADRIRDSVRGYKTNNNVSDITLRSTSQSGFSDKEIAALREYFGEENVFAGMSLDAEIDIDGERRLVRLCFSPDPLGETVDRLTLTGDVTAPEDGTTGIYALRADKKMHSFAPGDAVTLDFADIMAQLAAQADREMTESERGLLSRLKTVSCTVAGVVQSPRSFSLEGEPSYTNPADTEIGDTIGGEYIAVEGILYIPSSVIPKYSDIMPLAGSTPLIPTGEVGISLAGTPAAGRLFSRAYDGAVTEAEEKIISLIAEASEKSADEVRDGITFITLSENLSYKSVFAYADKVTALSVILLVAFSLICALVVLSNISRLMDEERAQTACLVTLGYTPGGVIWKYLLFVFTACAVGALAGWFIGFGLCAFVYAAFGFSYTMPAPLGVMSPLFFLISILVIVIAAGLATLKSGLGMAHEEPASLLRQKAPPAGRKVILERMPFIWNRLTFRYKSTARNVLRYRSRFLMTVFSVAGSMGLVMAGFSLLGQCLFGDIKSAVVAGLAAVIVIFAALLTMTAVYTITSISISERRREIATLMVLGYDDREVSGYIYREIYVDTVVGIILGFGVGAFLVWLVFTVMGIGTAHAAPWYAYILSPAVVLVATFIVTIILRREIVRVDMNASLKSNE